MATTTAMPTRLGHTTGLVGVGTFTAALPAGAAGDVLVLSIEQTSGSAPSATGWTLQATQVNGSRTGYVLTKVRAAGETSVTVTRTTDSAARWLITGVVGAKPDPSTWVLGVPRYRGTSPADSPNSVTTANGITTTALNTLALGIFGEATAAAEANPSTYVPTVTNGTAFAFSGQQSSADYESVLVAYKEMPTAGATGAMIATYPNGHSANAWGMLIGFPSVETSTIDPTPVGVPVEVVGANGVPVTGLATVWDGTKEISVTSIQAVHSGTFVPDLERAKRVFTMGHRGGSVDYQEHTPRGFVECAIRHIDIMEFSVGVTSDGRYFGLHDRTLNRTSSSVGPSAAQGGVDYVASEHTWAEISALQQDLPNREFGSARYMLLDTFLEQWAPSHTLMIDPKHLTTPQRVGFYERLAAVPDRQNRIMGKFFHTGTAVADDFRAIGCKSWGYAYSEAVTGLKSDGTATQEPLLSATAAKWDMLGMEWNASDAVWSETLRIAGGKKVIGHIVATVAQAQEAVRKGAAGLQVSGVKAVSAAF